MEAPTEEVSVCAMLDKLDQQCISQVCSKLAPKQLVLFGATCKPLHQASKESMERTTRRWEEWLAQMEKPVPYPKGWHGSETASKLDSLLMRFALDDHGGKEARKGVCTDIPQERRWLRQRCTAMGLTVDQEETLSSSNLDIVLCNPLGWQMPWDSEPTPWSSQCDDCGEPIGAIDRKKHRHLCGSCWDLFLYCEQQLAKMIRKEEEDEDDLWGPWEA